MTHKRKPLTLIVKDGWLNLMTGLGVLNKDKRMSAEVLWDLPGQTEVENMYAQDDMSAKIVDTLPEDALRQWIEIKGIEQDKEKKITDKLADLGAQTKLQQGWQQGRLYGGSGVMIVTDDSADLEKPLDKSRVRRVHSLTVFNRYELSVEKTVTSLRAKNFGDHELYGLYPTTTADEFSLKAHASRFMRFDGVKLPRKLEVTNHYWGDSVLTRSKNAIRNYNVSHDAATTALQDFNVDVFKMKNLAELVASGQEEDIRKRIEIANMGKSVIRALVLDMEEDYETKARTLTGVPDILKATGDRLSASTNMPHTKLLGESPSGLGATGDSELRNWYDFVKSQQTLVLKPHIDLLIELIQLELFGAIDPKLSWTFNSLWQPTEKEQTEIRNLQSVIDKNYIESQVLTPDEVAVSRFGGDGYSTDTVINMKMRVEPQDPIKKEPVVKPVQQ